MEREEIMNELRAVFCDVFDDETIDINDKTTANDIEDWDSLAQITLVSEIESRFSIRLKMSDVERLKNVGQMIDLIEELVNR